MADVEKRFCVDSKNHVPHPEISLKITKKKNPS